MEEMMLSMRPQLLSSSCPVTLLILLQLTLLPLCPSAQQICIGLKTFEFSFSHTLTIEPIPEDSGHFRVQSTNVVSALPATNQKFRVQTTNEMVIWSCNSSTKVSNSMLKVAECDDYTTSIASLEIISVGALNCSGIDNRIVTLTIADCPTLSQPANGSISLNTIPPSTANFSCDPGFTLLGNSVRMCQANSTWSGSEPSCMADVEKDFSCEDCFEACTNLDGEAWIEICVRFLKNIASCEVPFDSERVEDILVILEALESHIGTTATTNLYSDLLENDVIFNSFSEECYILSVSSDERHKESCVNFLEHASSSHEVILDEERAETIFNILEVLEPLISTNAASDLYGQLLRQENDFVFDEFFEVCPHLNEFSGRALINACCNDFVSNNFLEVGPHLNESSGGALIYACVSFLEQFINQSSEFSDAGQVKEVFEILETLGPFINTSVNIRLFVGLIDLDEGLAVHLNESIIELILNILEDLTDDERISDFADGDENSMGLSLQEMLLYAVEDLCVVSAQHSLLQNRLPISYNYTNTFVQVAKLSLEDSNTITSNKDDNNILGVELVIPALNQTENAVAARASFIIVPNLGSFLDIVPSSNESIVTSLGRTVSICILVENSGENDVHVEDETEKERSRLDNTMLLRDFSDNPVILTISSDLNDSLEECVSWNFTQSNWSSDGIRFGQDEELKVAQCNISHFSSFSVLVSPTGQGGGLGDTVADRALNVISYIGCAVSIVCLILTILALIVFRKTLNKGPLLYVHLNLSIALLISLLIFVSTVDPAASIHTLCVVTTSLLHYFLLASFCWMLCEGIVLYLMVVRVFGNAAKKWYWLLPLGWGLPVPVVAISAGVLEGSYDQGYSNHPTFCWLKADSAIWTFIVPMVIIILINTVILVVTIWSMIKGRQKGGAELDVKKKELAKTAIKGLVILLPLMGVTWVIGLFAVEENTAVFAWLFTIFNSLQGVFIFILHVLRNAALQKELKTCCNDACVFESWRHHTVSVTKSSIIT